MKKISLIMISIVLIFSLTGCFPDGTKTSSNTNADAGEEWIDDLVSIPSELHETLADNLIVDADIVVQRKLPDKTYKATLKEWDKDNIPNIFLSGKEIIEVDEIPNDFDNTKMNYTYTTDDGASLWIENGNILFDEKKAINRPYTRYVKGDSFFIDYNLKEIFTKDTLRNVDRESSIHSFKETCGELGIQISGEPDVYALDSETLDRITDYDEEQPNGERIEKWTEEEEVYFITAHVLYEEFPMTQFGYMTKSNFGVGTRLCAMYDADGLIYFSLYSGYEIMSDAADVNKICSLDTANNAIKEKYKNTILSSPVTISEIRLEYVPVQKDAEKQIYELTPMWIYTVSQDSQMMKDEKTTVIKNTFQIYVDALKGMEFDVGGLA